MARRDDILGVNGAETVIGAGVVVQGNLSSESDIMVDGELTGDVKAVGNVTIGMNARVKGAVNGRSVVVAGHLNGNVTSEEDVTIRETGHVTGNITSAGLAIVTGGIFNGRSTVHHQQHHELEVTTEEPAAN